jgi:putative ABC transport system substrate-binding protein
VAIDRGADSTGCREDVLHGAKAYPYHEGARKLRQNKMNMRNSGRALDTTDERRRLLLAAGLVALVAPGRAAAQAAPSYRIGFLGNSTPALEANLIGPFRQGLRDLGYVEGGNLAIEWRWAEGNYERFPKLVAELAAQKVAIIVTAGTPAALAVEKGAPQIPLVMVAVGDPVGTGLVKSLAVPGGNATGLTSIAPDLEGKRLELQKEIVPELERVSILWNPSNPFHVGSERQARAAARELRIDVHSAAVRTAADFDRAFTEIRAQRPGALIVLADRVFLHNRNRIVAFAEENRLPAVYAYRELVDAGGLMSFGPNYADMHRRAAYYVDRILKGAKAGELPIELPTKFELVINVKRAKALGLALPEAVLLRADEILR